MPKTAALVARLRAAFGTAVVDGAIRRGKDGEPTFHARENGRSVGTAGRPRTIQGASMAIRCAIDTFAQAVTARASARA
jgi:hypothetical protein